jgi:serine/threonine-protein kinase
VRALRKEGIHSIARYACVPRSLSGSSSDLLLEWEEAAEQGRALVLEELCRDCPHLLDELRNRVRALQKIDSLLLTGLLPPLVGGTRRYSSSSPDALTHLGKDNLDRRSVALPAVAGYEILGELGRGGMGVVYLARQQGLHRLVALKMILADTYASEQQRQRFKAEAEVIARLQHPNIVQIHEIGEVDGRAYCVLEYIAGGTLAEALDGKPLPPRAAAQLLATLADAVAAAHRQGIIHRDLKPGNVLLMQEEETTTKHTKDTKAGKQADADGASASFGDFRVVRGGSLLPKISDFGLAKQLAGSAGLTETNAVLGTPSYMARSRRPVARSRLARQPTSPRWAPFSMRR